MSLLLILLATTSSSAQAIKTAHGFSSIKEATMHDIQLAFKQNQLTSRKLVELYLKQISRLNPVLKGVLEVNPDALYQADKADHERKFKAQGLPKIWSLDHSFNTQFSASHIYIYIYTHTHIDKISHSLYQYPHLQFHTIQLIAFTLKTWGK